MICKHYQALYMRENKKNISTRSEPSNQLTSLLVGTLSIEAINIWILIVRWDAVVICAGCERERRDGIDE